MKITTFNINGIRARHDRLVEYLTKEQPDIVCLQELKADHDVHPEQELEKIGYTGVWHGQKGFNGVAILGKGEPPVLRRKGLPEDPIPDQARYIEAEYGGFVVASIYLPNGNPIGTEKFDKKLEWMARLADHAKELLAAEVPTVLAGDYNVIPEDRDTFSRSAMAKDALFQPESQQAFRALVAQGWTDALRTFHPDEKRLYTFWDYQRGAWQRDAGFRIDHLLCSPQAADRLVAANVDKWARGEEKASDHAPTWAQFA